MPPNRTCTALITAILTVPGFAAAADLGPGEVFANAALFQKFLIVGLVAATTVGVAISIRKLTSGPALVGGSAFVSGLRFGGPIAGVLGGAYAALKMSVGVATLSETPSLKVLAPGFAEIATLIALGFLSGVIAVTLHWAIEARIDRQVLAE